MHLEDLLSDLGYNVVGTASDGLEAIEKTRELNPDLIFMDIIMPGEMSGIEAAQEIKNEFDVPIIFLTAFVDDKIIERAKIIEPFSYIIKPFHGQDLKAAIEITLYRKKMENKLRESEEKYRTLVEKSRDGIGIIQDGIIKYANPILINMLGTTGEIDETPFKNYFRGKNKTTIGKLYNNCLYGKKVSSIADLELINKDDLTIHVETKMTLIKYEEKPAVLTFIRNLTSKKDIKILTDQITNVVDDCKKNVIPDINKLIENIKDKNHIELLRGVLSNIINCSNTMNEAFRLLQIKYEDE